MTEKYFKKMIELLEQMNERLERIEIQLSTDSSPPSSLDLLSKLQKSQLRTYFALKDLGEATCTEIADVTGRSHNLESRYLVKLKELSERYPGLNVNSKRVSVSDPKNPDRKWTEVKYYIEEND